ncbi:MAG: sugar ABC transporter substrate-binding protein [Clostridia bacterium]|jgi:ribose transport system substrate-binding protein|nr:sugar ABC transporter substrate-binding protein [Clostridia bacterium]
MKKMRKNFLWLIVVISLIGLLLVGCGGGDKPKEEQPKAEEKVFKVGINNFGQANFFARVGREAMIEQIEKNGGEVIATVTADVPSRLAAIENMIVQGVDAIIIQEGDITQVAPALIEAKEKGIIIGSMDAGDADFVDVFVESDNNHLGTAAAEKMVELIGGKGNIVEIFNDAGSMIRVRRNAMHEVIKAYPEIKIVAGFTYAWPDFFPDGKAKMEAILQAHPNPGDIAAVYATFDGVGLAAAQAIREAGLQDHIVIVGIDGDPEAYKEMALPDSPFKATMAQDPDTIARTVVDNVFELLKGNEIPERHIYIPGILVTKDNIPQQ